MKGTYILILEVPNDIKIPIGRLGKIKFQKGFYAYIGSALSSLEERIKRHLRKDKRIYWHIDYLLKKAKIKKIICMKSDKREECKIARKLENNFHSVKNFGSSDCSCRSHLFFSPNLKKLNECVEDIT